MTEFQSFGMEVKAVGRLAIKGVAYDRAVHTVGMSGMDAQLVGAACFGVVGDAGGCFPIIVIHANTFFVILSIAKNLKTFTSGF